MKDPLDRFLKKVQVGPLPVEWTGKPEDRTECLLWAARRNNGGYGQFKINGKRVLAHRWIYEQCLGKVQKGLDLDHLCRVRHCVNPLHLEPVTRKENLNRSPIHKKAVGQNGKKNGKNNGLNSRKYKLPEGTSMKGKKFIAQKWIAGKHYYLGTFTSPEKASQAYQDFILKFYTEPSSQAVL